MDAQDILKVKLPEHLFAGNDADSIKLEWKRYVSKYHPDKCAGSGNEKLHGDVTAHITSMYELGVEKIANGTWRMHNTTIVVSDSKRFRFKYLERLHHGVCTHAVNVTKSLYTINDPDAGGTFDIFFDNAVKMASTIERAVALSNRMKPVFAWIIPKMVEYKTADGKRCILNSRVNKLDGTPTPDTFPLESVLNGPYNGTIPARHVAWIMSRCYNIACLFEHLGYMYGGFTVDGLTIDPAGHTIVPSCGWWFTRKLDDKLIGLPTAIIPRLSPTLLTDKKATTKIDTTMIKLLGRQLLGDITGRTLSANPDIPKPMLNWLMDPAGDCAERDFEAWDSVLNASFGARTFVVMDVTKSNLYTEEVL